MCIAIVKTKGSDLPTEEEFRKCFATNRDGAGIAWMEESVCKWVKGLMTIDAFLAALKEIGDLKDKAAMFHFRIATHGCDTLKQGLTHPFPITSVKSEQVALTGQSRLIGMHNGVLYKYGSLKADDPASTFSDTVNFIGDFITPLLLDAGAKAFMDPEIAKKIEGELGYSNKFAIMGDGEVKHYGSGWIEHNGNFFSNAGFRPYASSSTSDPRAWGKASGGGKYSNYYNGYAPAARTPSAREEWRTSIRILKDDETFMSSDGKNTPVQFMGADFTEPLLVDEFERVFQNFPTKKKETNWIHVGYLNSTKDHWSYYDQLSLYD